MRHAIWPMFQCAIAALSLIFDARLFRTARADLSVFVGANAR
jgi:hypothetical protein